MKYHIIVSGMIWFFRLLGKQFILFIVAPCTSALFELDKWTADAAVDSDRLDFLEIVAKIIILFFKTYSDFWQLNLDS